MMIQSAGDRGDSKVVGRIFVVEEGHLSDRNCRSGLDMYYFVKEGRGRVEDAGMVVISSLDQGHDRTSVEVADP